jgi:putative sterol carrier protein
MVSPVAWVLIAFVVLSAIGFWLWPKGLGRVLSANPVACLYTGLLIMAVLPPLIGRDPFTYYFAKRSTPRQVWQTDIFYNINRFMNWIWAGLFAAATISALLPTLFSGLKAVQDQIIFQAAIPVGLMVGVGLPFTKKYPDYHQRKLGLEPARQDSFPESPKKGEEAMSPVSPKTGGAYLAKTCRELLQVMPLGFQADQAGDLEAVYQFEVGQPENFTAHIKIEHGQAVFHDGPADRPDVVIKTPPDIWLKISRGEMNGQMAFMSGKFKAKGNLGLLMEMNKLFKG